MVAKLGRPVVNEALPKSERSIAGVRLNGWKDVPYIAEPLRASFTEADERNR